MLESALERLDARGGRVLVVMREGRILGLVTHHTVGELLTMRQATRRSA
jgi:hypothetical protein